jgi:hypothetical protein
MRPMKPCNVFLRLTPDLDQKLESLVQQTAQPRNVILRYLLAKASLEDLPSGWRNLSAEERELLKLAG